MASLNRALFIGRLTADPDTRTTTEGVPLSRFSLAVDRPPRADGTKEVDFIPVVAWRNLADICGKYLKKGRLTLIEGTIQVRSYEDQQGERQWVTEVVARNMKMLDKAPSTQTAAELPLPPETFSEEAAMAEVMETPWGTENYVQ